MDALFTLPMVVYTAPLLLAVGLWLLTFLGAFDVDADVDLDLDLDAADGLEGGWLSTLGLGAVPLSITASVFLFLFGLLGLLLNVSGWAQPLIAGLAVAGAGVATVGVARLLAPAFESGTASRSQDLIGRTATVRSNSIDASFGAATLKLPNGDRIEINARTAPGEPTLAYGQQVVVFDYNPDANLYFVGALDDDSALPEAPSRTRLSS
ncbi:MAG: hypothetical protein AAF730_05310 [Bacteroidota bacterium]